MLADEAPNVVSEDGFRLLLNEGYDAIVVSHSTIEKEGVQWAGRWTVWVSKRESQDNRLLVASRGHLKPREFKTTYGLIGFLRKMGFATAVIPFHAGARAVQDQGGRNASPMAERALDT